MSKELKSRNRRILYGRRQTRKLTGRQAALMENTLPGLSVSLSDPKCQTPAELFSGKIDKVCLEIGFGGGEHLAAQAAAHPELGMIGAEPFINGVAKLVSSIDQHGLQNIRIFQGDARDILDALGEHCLARVFLLYPDPWPKRRHHKRRFVGPENLHRLHRVLEPGGQFIFASDISDYVRWTLREVALHGGFEWSAQGPGDWRTPPKGWPGTRYEKKAVREGRVPVYLKFFRN